MRCDRNPEHNHGGEHCMAYHGQCADCVYAERAKLAEQLRHVWERLEWAFGHHDARRKPGTLVCWGCKLRAKLLMDINITADEYRAFRASHAKWYQEDKPPEVETREDGTPILTAHIENSPLPLTQAEVDAVVAEEKSQYAPKCIAEDVDIYICRGCGAKLNPERCHQNKFGYWCGKCFENGRNDD